MGRLIVVFILIVVFELCFSLNITEINLIVFHDDVSNSTPKLIERAKNHYNSKANDSKIEKVYIVNLMDMDLNYTSICSHWEEWTKSEHKPSIVLDFSTRDNNARFVRHISLPRRFPMISTTSASNQEFNYMVYLTRTQKNPFINLVQFHSPLELSQTTIAQLGERIGFTEAYFKDAYKDLLFQRDVVSYYDQHFNQRYSNYKGEFVEVPLHNITLGEYLLEEEINYVFISGNLSQIKETFQSTQSQGKQLYNEQHSFWAISNEINGEFKLPEFMNRLILLTPALKNTTESVEFAKKLKSNDLQDFFYTDVFLATARAIGKMKKLNDWKDPKFNNSLDFNFNITYILKSELKFDKTLLGNYLYWPNSVLKFPQFEPMINYKMTGFGTNGKPTIVGIASPGVKGTVEVLNRSAFLSNLAVKHYNATIVVDPPFVIRDESCFANKTKEDESIKCYSGFLVHLLHKINDELGCDLEHTNKSKGMRNCKILIKEEKPYGVRTIDGDWTGALGDISISQNKKMDRQIGIGAFTINKKRKKVMELSTSFFRNTATMENYGFAFSFGSELKKSYSHMIAKLKNQRYLEQLREMWWNDSIYCEKHNCRNMTHPH